MKMMLFFWAEEISKEIQSTAKYLSNNEHNFILAPLIRLKDKPQYANSLIELSKNNNVSVAPIYLKSQDSNISNLFNLDSSIHDFLSISNVIKGFRPDVIISFYIQHALPLVFLKGIFSFTLIPVAMGSDVNIDNSILQRLTKQIVYRNSSLIFARSWKLKEKIQAPHKSTVIVNPSSTDTSFFVPLSSKADLRTKWGICLTSKIVLFVGRLDKNKGPDVLLKSIAALESNDVKILLVGDGPEKTALKRLSVSLGIQSSVSFLGGRDKQELRELYNLSDVFVLSSYAEGLPRVVLEAMACGCIPIATDVGSVNAVITSGYNGFMVDPGDSSAISDCIKKILFMTDKELETIRSRARSKVVEDFDGRKVWQQLVDEVSTRQF